MLVYTEFNLKIDISAVQKPRNSMAVTKPLFLLLGYLRSNFGPCLILFYLLFSVPTLFLFGLENEEGESNLLQDLMIVNYWNNRLNEKFPVTYNHLLEGGYFSMPSARMGPEGELAVGYGYVHPYIHYNLKFQLADFFGDLRQLSNF